MWHTPNGSLRVLIKFLAIGGFCQARRGVLSSDAPWEISHLQTTNTIQVATVQRNQVCRCATMPFSLHCSTALCDRPARRVDAEGHLEAMRELV